MSSESDHRKMNNLICTICWDSLTVTDTLSTKCGHLFHKKCLFTWLKQQMVCPICKIRIGETDTHQIIIEVTSDDPSGDVSVEDELDNHLDRLLARAKFLDCELEILKSNSKAEEETTKANKLKLAANKKKISKLNNEIKEMKEKIEDLCGTQPAPDMKINEKRDKKSLAKMSTLLKKQLMETLRKQEKMAAELKSLKDPKATTATNKRPESENVVVKQEKQRTTSTVTSTQSKSTQHLHCCCQKRLLNSNTTKK